MTTPKKVAICVGHSRRVAGRIEGGAVSTGGMNEHTYNSQVAERLMIHLARDGRVHPFLFKEYKGGGYDAAMDWLARMLRHHESGRPFALALELHFNSNDADDNPETPDDAHGMEQLYYTTSPQSKAAAQAIDDAQAAAFPNAKRRGLKPIKKGGRGWQFLKYTPCPAVIAEPFFGSNVTEWNTYAHRIDDLARAQAAGILAYLFPTA